MPTLLVALAVGVLVFLPSPADAQCAPRTDGIIYTEDCTAGSSTAGINEAIAACVVANRGCIIHLPAATLNISQQVVIGHPAVTLRGHGSSHASGGSGTRIFWVGGVTSQSVIRIQAHGIHLESFDLNATNAGYGIEYVGDANLGIFSTNSFLYNLTVRNPTEA